MPKVQIYDAPVCSHAGAGVLQGGPHDFDASLEWLAAQGVAVERYNLTQHPQAYISNETVKAALMEEGVPCLPLILVDGCIASCGGYPSQEELAELTGLQTKPRPDGDRPRSAFKIVQGRCCG